MIRTKCARASRESYQGREGRPGPPQGVFPDGTEVCPYLSARDGHIPVWHPKKCGAFARGIFLLLAATGLLAADLDAREPVSGEGYTKQIVVTPLLRTTKTACGQPIAYPKTDSPQVTAVMVDIPPGAETGWHQHPFPCYAYILSGKLTVEVKGEKPRELHAGEALVEVVNTTHNGMNKGTEPVRLVMFATGEEDKPFTVRVPDPEPKDK
ncbi:MAG: cupin domain-containing protein [Verrucomicrobiota bacterium]